MIGVATGTLMSTVLVLTNPFNDEFTRANQAYANGDFRGSVDLYERLVAEGVVDADLFFNLGNAYFRAGQIAPAIANYERTLQLDPGYEAAELNRDLCVRQTQRQLSKPLPPAWEQSLLFWHYGLSPRAAAGWAVGLWLLFWGVLTLRLRRPFPYSRAVATVCFFAAAAFGTSAWVKKNPQTLAVAGVDRAQVRYGIGERETVHFELFEGDRVVVDRRANGWSRVRTASGERGWVDDRELAFVGPPYTRPAALGMTEMATKEDT